MSLPLPSSSSKRSQSISPLPLPLSTLPPLTPQQRHYASLTWRIYCIAKIGFACLAVLSFLTGLWIYHRKGKINVLVVFQVAIMTFMSWDVKDAWRKRREMVRRVEEEREREESLLVGGGGTKGEKEGKMGVSAGLEWVKVYLVTLNAVPVCT